MAADRPAPLARGDLRAQDSPREGPDRPGAPLSPRVVYARGLSRQFDGRGVLRDVDLDLRRGELVALLGRAGSGKSTLLRILARLDTRFEGHLQLPTTPALVFQDARLLPWRRVIDNVRLGHPAPVDRARAAGLLRDVGLAGRGRDWPRQLVGSEPYRVALARAFMPGPELLLLDEPFGSLDALTRLRMYELLGLLRGRDHPAVLIVTHDIDDAIRLADRIVVLEDGSIRAEIPVELGQRGRSTATTAGDLRARLLDELGMPAASV